MLLPFLVPLILIFTTSDFSMDEPPVSVPDKSICEQYKTIDHSLHQVPANKETEYEG